jgi:hypothetical protein
MSDMFALDLGMSRIMADENINETKTTATVLLFTFLLKSPSMNTCLEAGRAPRHELIVISVNIKD